jgi:hypothetical protein
MVHCCSTVCVRGEGRSVHTPTPRKRLSLSSVSGALLGRGFDGEEARCDADG